MNRKMYDAILWSHNRQQLQQYLPDGEFFPPPTCGHNSRELQLWICKVAEGSWDGPHASWCTKNYSNQITPFGRQITPFRRQITPFHFLHFFGLFFWNLEQTQNTSNCVRSLPPFPHTNLNGGNKMLPFLRNPKVFGIFDITHHFLKHCFRASAPRCRRHKRWQRSAGVNLRSQGNRKAWLTSKHFWGSYALVNEVTTDSSVTICCLVETNKTKKWVHP